jgi:mono/diheme cytochrome c family protein
VCERRSGSNRRDLARAAAGALLLSLALLAGCHSSTVPRLQRPLTAAEQRGQAVFAAQCAQCHYADRRSALHGPGLRGIFRRPYLPSGAPANDDRVRATIEHGRNMMPPFGDSLNDQQMRDLLAYLHTL